jgi:GNAT superfamily N-acetyltransferase
MYRRPGKKKGNKDMRHWYEKLSQYFPIEEMKSRTHMETLLQERGDIYHKDESPLHVLMYVELDTFIFVDYLLVTREARGQGLGQKLLDKLKAKKKPILLEVEPLDYDDSDTVKRHRFYLREDFQPADAITYRRRSIATREVVELEILYWTPDPSTSEADIFEHMQATYEEVHTFRDTHFYGEAYQPAAEVLTLDAHA